MFLSQKLRQTTIISKRRYHSSSGTSKYIQKHCETNSLHISMSVL